MNLFVNGKLNPAEFESDLRQATDEFAALLVLAANTQSAKIESTHFLLALAKVRDGETRKLLARHGVQSQDWDSGLSAAVLRSAGLPPTQLAERCFDESAMETLGAASDFCAKHGLPRVSEGVLLLSALRHLTAGVSETLKYAGIDLDQWRQEVQRTVEPVKEIDPFDGAKLDPEKFSPSGNKVLDRMRAEAEALAFTAIDPRHLLLALLECEGGATQLGLHKQAIRPKKIQEGLLLRLSARGKRARTELPLDEGRLAGLLQRILRQAGKVAARASLPRIAEAHLLQAFLDVDSAALGALQDEKVDLAELRRGAESFDVSDEKEERPLQLADIETVRTRLMERLVGQEDAVNRILPYIQRMRFGFTTPDHPMGVFLFCGQSGSGKTEMAKELARAVYGSEENLIFLEMGQFNSKESMNMFMGAPPGYIGYGDGKLTNGLRDRPRAVVLFDEIEKSFPQVLDALLRFVDEGKIEDPAGPVRDGSQCLVIMTSNVGAEKLTEFDRSMRGKSNWQTEIRKLLREEFRKKAFRVEFLNRLDEVILFRTLGGDDYAEIARRLMKRELGRLRDQRQITVVSEPDGAVEGIIGAYCGTVDEGARAVRRLIQSLVITPVIDFVVRNNCAPPITLAVRAAQPESGGEPTSVVERR